MLLRRETSPVRAGTAPLSGKATLGTFMKGDPASAALEPRFNRLVPNREPHKKRDGNEQNPTHGQILIKESHQQADDPDQNQQARPANTAMQLVIGALRGRMAVSATTILLLRDRHVSHARFLC